MTGVATAINNLYHHAPILVQIMQATAAAHLQGRLIPKRRCGQYVDILVMGSYKPPHIREEINYNMCSIKVQAQQLHNVATY